MQGDGQASQPEVVDTLGGRMHVRWDSGAAIKDIILDVQEQEVITRDNAVIVVNAIAFIKVTDPARWPTAAATRQTSAMCWAR